MSKFIELTDAKKGHTFIVDLTGCVIEAQDEGCIVFGPGHQEVVKESYEDLIKILDVKRTSYKN